MDKAQLARKALEQREQLTHTVAQCKAELAVNDDLKAEMVRTLLEGREKALAGLRSIVQGVGTKNDENIGAARFIDSNVIPLGELPVPDSASPLYAFASISLQLKLEQDHDRHPEPITTIIKKSLLLKKDVTVEPQPIEEQEFINSRCTIEYITGDENGENLVLADLQIMPWASDDLEKINSQHCSDSVLARAYNTDTRTDVVQLLDFIHEIESLKSFVTGQEETA